MKLLFADADIHKGMADSKLYRDIKREYRLQDKAGRDEAILETFSRLGDSALGFDGSFTDSFILFYIQMSFSDSERETYVLGQEFAKELQKVPLHLEWGLVPKFKDDVVCLELPEPLWVRVGLNTFTSVLCRTSQKDEGGENVSLVFSNKHSSVDRQLPSCVVHLGSATGTIEESVKELITDAALEVGVRLVLNALLYINTGDPDLRHTRLGPMPEQINKRAAWRRKREVMSERPYTLVGFNFKKPPIYHINSTDVCGHFRWQPHGPKNSLLKLIWIEPHTRTYKDELVEEEVSNAG